MTFIDCVAWEKTADLIGKYFKKGSRILVHASAKTESWVDKENGKNRHKIKFIVQKFWYVDQKSSDEEEQSEVFAEEDFGNQIL